MNTEFNSAPSPIHPPAVKNQTKRGILTILGIVVFIGGLFASFQLGLAQGKKGFVFEPKEFKVVNVAEQPAQVDYKLLWDAIKTVKDKYIEDPANDLDILYGATRGAVAAMGDEYTQFFSPKELQSFKTDLKGSFFGIGAEIGKKNDALVIVAPLDDSPAQKAGVLPGDYILQVNGEATNGWSTEQAVSKIRGDKKGESVTLQLFREGKTQPFEVTILRDEIKIKSVKWEIKEVSGKKVGVIKMARFGDDTLDLLEEAKGQLLAEKVQALILDVRSDPGGYLETAVEVASHWLDKGELVVSEVSRSQADSRTYTSSGHNTFKGLKTVVLINGGSASASEIVAGALHDHNVATLVGEKSFGKGSVQQLVELSAGGAVKVTIAKWVTPGGKNLNKDGLVPDIEVKLTEQDLKDKKDPQMDKALEEVTK
jgi:carboxyl-terminal processing protease